MGGATMMPDSKESQVEGLSEAERQFLLVLARRALENAVCGEPPPELRQEDLSTTLVEFGASFVTLTRRGMLRGCIGAIEPYQGLAEDVREHAAAAALEDYRFAPVRPDELPEICIEVSRLTKPIPLDYENAEELVNKIRPGIDGVVIRDGFRRATFLPQVWEKIPQQADFMAQLCQKMGARSDLWRHKKLEVFTYQVEEFCEPG
jgi:AmmeMemoRadiSam system protein A